MRTSDSSIDRAWANIRAAEQRIAWECPFHGFNLASMRMGPDPAAETMRIGKAKGIVTVGFSSDFVAGLTVTQTAAVLKHELHHLVFGHLAHTRSAFPNTLARTIAEEVCANEWIEARDLPGKPILLSQFPELRENQTFEERYKLLSGLRLDQDPRTAGLGDEIARRESDAGTITRSDVARMAEAAVANLGAEKAAKGMAQGMQRAVLNGIGRGTEAGGLSVLVPVAEGKAVIPWAAKLRKFLGMDAGHSQPTYCRPSRRHRSLAGLVPGWETKPRNPRLMMVLDTSGSMDDTLLAEVQREIRAIVPHCEPWLVQCDTQVHEVRRIGAMEMASPLKLHGRGGTDFRPALCPDLIRRIRPAWIVVFTDGQGPAPESPPPCRLAWILCGPRASVPANYGEVIEMGSHNCVRIPQG